MAQTAKRGAAQIVFSFVGFGCNQAFLFLMMFLGANRSLSLGPCAIELSDGLFCLLFMMLAFGLYPRLFNRDGQLLRRGKLAAVLVASMMAGAALQGLTRAMGWDAQPLTVVACALMAVPCAWLFCAWGGLLCRESISRFVPEVFLGSALAGAICLAASVLPESGGSLVMAMTAAGNGFYLAKLRSGADGGAGDAPCPPPSRATEADPEALRLGARMVAGTLFFGLALGAVQALATVPGAAAAPGLSWSFFLFVLFSIGALQLFGRNPLFSGISILPKVDAPAARSDEGPLDGAYRLAVVIMMAGFLAVPVLSGTSMPGEAVALAGYLAVETVLVCLFMVMGSLSGGNAGLGLSRGLLFLFLGQALGILAASLLQWLSASAAMAYGVGALAGVMALCAYLFLFTDRDLRSLSVVVSRQDGFERRVERMAAAFVLSKRESEILPFVLKGRTAERIASELFISKNTVDTHIRRIYGKCGVHNRQQLIDLSETLDS